ncbi:zinc-dependent metalloprotease [Nocardiopsis lambiniae]|uniref:Zinc-dependent metalloprotease n=1 Tax=Nocardiopsis lambiniae TaxID=3075539 RepID=A0ABU2MIA7_9ACTN|nr:zinc-dependent metalloprotease [Nocardiopsis sp. DSM 44743]MDT0331596.1 zinc-dependent metalloprotease [Nocardiopsis sp. DSM 44743]
MSDLPFGFSMPNDPDDESGRRPGDSGSGGAGSGRPGGGDSGTPDGFPFGDPQQMANMLRQFADMMSAQPAPGGDRPASASGINWSMAKDIARQVVAQKGDPSVPPADYAKVQEALRLGDLWLDQSTALPSGIQSIQAWSRSEWIEKTMDSWSQLCDPLTSKTVRSMGQSLPEEMRSMAGPLLGMIQQMGGMMVGQQAGQAVGELSQEVVGTADIGLPLAGEGNAALLPLGVEKFSEGLEIPDDEVRLYLAAREAAVHRLYAHVPWLRSHVFRLVAEYADGMSFDVSGLEDRLGEIDLTDPEALQEVLGGAGGGQGLFQPEDTPQQKAALNRLETTLALIEGWVAIVVSGAVDGRLPQANALAEATRRRRATGGPAEHTFAALVGLELRPRRLREASALWTALEEARGIDGRDAVWQHPDLMPTGEDLDDPAAFVSGGAFTDTDFDISALTDEAPGVAKDEGEKDPRKDEPGEDS